MSLKVTNTQLDADESDLIDRVKEHLAVLFVIILNPDYRIYPLEQVLSEGRRVVANILKEDRLVDGEFSRRDVRRIGQKVIAAAQETTLEPPVDGLVGEWGFPRFTTKRATSEMAECKCFGSQMCPACEDHFSDEQWESM